MTTRFHVASPTPEETRRLAAAVASLLRAGDVVALTGELGAGKTCFVQGAAAALGVQERVTSPSFVLRRDYEGRVPVLHIDVYRLDTLQEVVELGWDEALEGTHVSFVEWGDAMSPLLPTSHLEIEFRLAELGLADTDGEGARDGEGASDAHGDGASDGTEERRLVVRPRGEDWRRRVPQLRAALEPWLAEQVDG